MIAQPSPGLRILCVATVIALGLAATPAQAQKIVLKGITPWSADYDLSKAFFMFEELVEEKLGDKVEIRYLGGPEVSDPNDQFSALKNGVVDVLLGAAAYYRSDVPLSAAVQFTSLLPSELRTSGYFDLMQQIHKEGGVYYLANTSGGNKFRLYLNKEISKPDFSGLRLRGSPVQLPMIRALGGTPISISPGDVYTALERHVIDGYGWTYSGIDTFGWNEVSKYVVNHPFYSLDGAILINQKVWDSLPQDVQAGLNEVGVELEKRVEKSMGEILSNEDQRLEKLGMKFITFSEADANYFQETALKAGWDEFLRMNAKTFEKDPALAEKLQQTAN
ncbi:TRAP transporter substrate-binding protein DctP [Paenalcaligenes niemegkensis]|uniref:TRAP transporter substrate-binding protein DctP n=1 Tax=Paenalcaligenes niemegkensis TaxID=2895469 RepID=UPI001EE7CE96|nr:TRAP transporter substrate-binding protein DctP [Paenalcaligenes niemegkensis]MCQ9618278.1 TRAP transporter substrate-binding protein DctP [Paenalcaligenes niemegkensis]